MSALDMSNSVADSDHQSALAIIGQNKIQETALESKEEPWASLVVRTLHPLGSMRAPRCPSRFTTLHVGLGGIM